MGSSFSSSYTELRPVNAERLGRVLACDRLQRILLVGCLHAGKSTVASMMWQVIRGDFGAFVPVTLSGSAPFGVGAPAGTPITLASDEVSARGKRIIDSRHAPSDPAEFEAYFRALIRGESGSEPVDAVILVFEGHKVVSSDANGAHQEAVRQMVVQLNKICANSADGTVRKIPLAALGTHADAVGMSVERATVLAQTYTMINSTYMMEGYHGVGGHEVRRKDRADTVLLKILDSFARFYAAHS